MAREFSRQQRVNEELKRELGYLITTQVKDPRVSLVTVTDVDVSPDLKNAKVYIGTFDITAEHENPKQALAGLKAAQGFLKKELGKRMRLRVMPELRFIEDATEREAQRLDSLIADAIAEDEKHASDADSDSPSTASDDESH